MKGMSRVTARAFEAIATQILTKVLGESVPYTDDSAKWVMPYGATGRVEIILFRASHLPRGEYMAPWLACRHRDPELVSPDGYMKPGARHPSPFSMSGKCNLHPGYEGGVTRMTDEIASHMRMIAPFRSAAEQAFNEILAAISAEAA